VTYLFEGEIMHRDSVGSEQAIRPGDVNWMIAGRGITHSERFERARREGGRMHGIQAWVALPEADEETDPAFAHHGVADLPVFEQDGARGRLIVGSAHGLSAGVAVHSPMFYLHWEMAAGSHVALPDNHPERALYIVSGTVELGEQSFESGQMLVISRGADAVVTARTPAIVMVLGGEPLGPRFIEWNFVSSSKERIEQAKADWRAGRMKLPDLDDSEFVPLPPGPTPTAQPMS
jgi:redox-sensitive bicupin YhaK (pirin superfamily)